MDSGQQHGAYRSEGTSFRRGGDTAAPVVAEIPGDETPRPVARPDGGSEAPGDPAPTPAGRLGETVATLGDPTRPGLWLETPLVSTETPGRVVAENGNSLDLTLLPIEGDAGAGSRLSLAAMRAIPDCL